MRDSPILFNIYGGININGVKISYHRYADDTTLLALSNQKWPSAWDWNLPSNKSKTRFMVVDRFAAIQSTDLLQEYETVEQFQYLDSMTSTKVNSKPDVRRRCGMARTAMMELSKVWKDRNIESNKVASGSHTCLSYHPMGLRRGQLRPSTGKHCTPLKCAAGAICWKYSGPSTAQTFQS